MTDTLIFLAIAIGLLFIAPVALHGIGRAWHEATYLAYLWRHRRWLKF